MGAYPTPVRSSPPQRIERTCMWHFVILGIIALPFILLDLDF